MIHFFIGTKAQFIKMAPVMAVMDKKDIPYRYIDSGQHAEFTSTLRKGFNIREPDICLNKEGRDVTTMISAAKWMFSLGMSSVFQKKWLKEKVFPGKGICLVHGDTLSTLLGLKMAKAAGLDVGHIEAGLRSYSFLHPFPEEIIRVYCMNRCDILFAPSLEAMENLKKMKVRGMVEGIEGNTVVDALRLSSEQKTEVKIPSAPYALAACHRFETITRKSNLLSVVNLLNRVARDMNVVFAVHKPTRRYLEKFGLKNRLETNVEVIGMQD